MRVGLSSSAHADGRAGCTTRSGWPPPPERTMRWRPAWGTPRPRPGLPAAGGVGSGGRRPPAGVAAEQAEHPVLHGRVVWNRHLVAEHVRRAECLAVLARALIGDLAQLGVERIGRAD